MSNFQISRMHYESLLRFVGYGDLPRADLIVLGNEEHVDGYSMEANIRARVERFGRHEASEQVYSMTCANGDTVYYEPSLASGRAKLDQYVRADRGEQVPQHDATPLGTLNPTLARICLALERPDDQQWFASASANADAWAEIKRYARESLFCPREGVRTAIVDWKPLPREAEDGWYYDVYGSIAQGAPNDYLRAFEKPLRRVGTDKLRNEFSDFYADMRKRADLLRQTFERSGAKLVLSVGGSTGFKRDVFELMYGRELLEPLDFPGIDMTNARGSKLTALRGRVKLDEGRTMTIVLVPFPEAGTIF